MTQGDVEAFTKLVRAHSSLVYRVALRMLSDEDAQDAGIAEVPDGTAKGW
jgi:DNA-directed RNA polymerase specialized sigma24 family protein